MIRDYFLRKLVISLALLGVIGGLVVFMAETARYKPYGVSDLERPAFEAKVKRIKESEAAAVKAKELGIQPVFHCDQTEHNFGLIDPHSSVTHTFRIENRGKAPLQVIAVDTSCKCTLSKVEAEWIEPGKSTDVTLTFNSGPKAEYYRQWSLIHTNDPDHREIELVVSGEIKATLATNTQELVFDGLKPEATAEQSFRVYSQCWSDFKLDKIESDIEHTTWVTRPLDAHELEPLKAVSGWQVTYRITPTNQMRYVNGMLRIWASPDMEHLTSLVQVPDQESPSEENASKKTDEPTDEFNPENANKPHLVEITIRGSMQRLLALMGNHVYADEGIRVGLVGLGQERELKIPMRWRGESSSDSLKVTSVFPEFLQVSIEPGKHPNLPVLRIVVPKTAPECLFEKESKGHIEISSPELPGGKFMVPLKGSIAPLPEKS